MEISDTMKKHAYLIIAHNNWEQLKKLILLLDDCRNDIFLHIDKKCGEITEIINSLTTLCKSSNINIFQEFSVNWGGTLK